MKLKTLITANISAIVLMATSSSWAGTILTKNNAQSHDRIATSSSATHSAENTHNSNVLLSQQLKED